MPKTTPEREDTKAFIRREYELGFSPDITVSYHLSHPNEIGRILKETDFQGTRPDRYSLQTPEPLWSVVTRDKYYDHIRSDYDSVEKDTGHLRNLFIKYLYGCKRVNQEWNHGDIRFMFFHERNSCGQYHTHVLLDSTGMITDNIIDIQDILKTSVRKRAKSISKRRRIYCEYTRNEKASCEYLTKTVDDGVLALDWTNSKFIQRKQVSA
jgi:hypothetical protein